MTIECGSVITEIQIIENNKTEILTIPFSDM